MFALVAGVVVPVAIEEVGEDLRLDLAGGEGLVAAGVAVVSGGEVGCGDGRAVGIDGRGEDDRLTVRRPLGVVGFGGDACELSGIVGSAGGGVEVGEPDL